LAGRADPDVRSLGRRGNACLAAGLIQEITEPGKHLERAIELAEGIASRSAPLGVRATLASAQRALAEGDEAAVSRLTDDMVALLRTEDGGEGMMSFIERRPARFTGR
jgi:enoyl-CoA hydratase